MNFNLVLLVASVISQAQPAANAQASAQAQVAPQQQLAAPVVQNTAVNQTAPVAQNSSEVSNEEVSKAGQNVQGFKCNTNFDGKIILEAQKNQGSKNFTFPIQVNCHLIAAAPVAVAQPGQNLSVQQPSVSQNGQTITTTQQNGQAPVTTTQNNTQQDAQPQQPAAPAQGASAAANAAAQAQGGNAQATTH